MLQYQKLMTMKMKKKLKKKKIKKQTECLEQNRIKEFLWLEMKGLWITYYLKENRISLGTIATSLIKKKWFHLGLHHLAENYQQGPNSMKCKFKDTLAVIVTKSIFARKYITDFIAIVKLKAKKRKSNCWIKDGKSCFMACLTWSFHWLQSQEQSQSLEISTKQLNLSRTKIMSHISNNSTKIQKAESCIGKEDLLRVCMWKVII